MTPQQAMPELPKPELTNAYVRRGGAACLEDGYHADQMHAYAITYAESLRSELDAARAVLKSAMQLCQWISESPHHRGSINGMAAQVLHAASAAPSNHTPTKE